jgi:hypothetical protein
MKTKRIGSAALACCLALTLSAVPAAADDDEQTQPETETVETAEPAAASDTEGDDEQTQQETETEDDDTIAVVVPSSGQVTLNPYKVKTKKDTSTAQIEHAPQVLKNNSTFPITVSVDLVGTISEGSEAAFVSAPPAADCTDKNIFLYVEFGMDAYSWAEDYTGAANQLVTTTQSENAENVLTLEASERGYFRFSGAMATKTLWEDTDTFTATLSYTFTPVGTEDISVASFDAESVEEMPILPAEAVTEPEATEDGVTTDDPAATDESPAVTDSEPATDENAATDPAADENAAAQPDAEGEGDSQTTAPVDEEAAAPVEDAQTDPQTDPQTDEDAPDDDQSTAAPAEDAQTDPEPASESDGGDQSDEAPAEN